MMHASKSSVQAATLLARPVADTQKRRLSTRGKVNYADRPKTDEALYVDVYTDKKDSSNLSVTEADVTVHDVRPVQSELSLEENGFVLRKLKVPELDWQNKNEVESVFYPLVERLLKETTGASRVLIFDHTLRLGQVKTEQGKLRTLNKQGQPIGMAHVDYTADSGIDRLDALMPEEASKLRETPFAVIQVWRPLRGPVRSSPLGMIDASTVDRSDLTPYQINFPGRSGYNYAVHKNPKHKWYFADQMETDEAYVFVCYDSRTDRARFTPHSGFRDLSVGDDAPPRESVELRSYVFWENEAPQKVLREW